jgi:H+/Cl- antiporter ClcA/CBS domain-containing protein
MENKTSSSLADFSVDSRVLIISGMSIFIGTMSTIVASVLVKLIALITNLLFNGVYSTELQPISPGHLGLWVILAPAAGGLIIGLMARYGSEKIRGHGIPEALEAILIGRSRMDLKVAMLKPLSSAISIGTGGPFGAEGPIIMTGGAFASLFAQTFRLSSAERKTLLVAGAAAGMSAIFNTPIAAALLAVELLLFEWRPRSLIPVAVACCVACGVRVLFFPSGPLFPIVGHGILGWETLLVAFLLGMLSGGISGILTSCVYGFEEMFEKLPFHWMWWPALGGLVVGLGGYFDPRALGVGYDVIAGLLNGQIIGLSAVTLVLSKGFVWAFALGSGTSGGVLAPLLIIGGAVGALCNSFLPAGDASLWALIGMAAVMGGTMRCPFTALVFVVELTHDVNALPALFVATIAADAVTVLLLKRSILTEKVSRHGHHIARDYSVDPLDLLRVEEVMDTKAVSILPEMPLQEFCSRAAKGDPDICRHQGVPIVNKAGELCGIITRGDVLRSLEKAADEKTQVGDVGAKKVVTVFPDEILREAVDKMLRNNIGRLPVVDPENPKKLIGYLGRTQVMAARQYRLTEDTLRESVWSSRRRSSTESRPTASH